MTKKADRKIIATTVVIGNDNFYHAAHVRVDGTVEIFAHEGAGTYLREEPVALEAAERWGIYYVPNHFAKDEDRLDRICKSLAARPGWAAASILMENEARDALHRIGAQHTQTGQDVRPAAIAIHARAPGARSVRLASYYKE